MIAPKGETTRPTPDRLREALFSIVATQIEGAHFTDFYSGSGAVGFEALSRGAARCTFIEHDRAALEALRQNVKALGVESRTELIAKPVGSVLHQRPWKGILFLDPPYEAVAEYESCLQWFGKSEAELVLVQHDRRLKLADQFGRLKCTRQLKQGDNRVSFYCLAGG